MRLRVLSYNIHKCIGGVDRRYQPERVAEVIKNLDCDVLMLQEVDAGVARSNRDSQVDILGEALGLKYRTWYPNVTVRGGGQYGNAILSRYPLIESTNIDLTQRFKKPRSVLHGVIRVRHDEIDRTVHVFNMHLGLARYERKRQLQMFLDSHPFANLHEETPVVVGGDRRPRTFPAWGPLRALDGIFVRGQVDFLGLARCDSDLARRASDHRPLVAEVRLTAVQAHGRDEHKPPAPRP